MSIDRHIKARRIPTARWSALVAAICVIMVAGACDDAATGPASPGSDQAPTFDAGPLTPEPSAPPTETSAPPTKPSAQPTAALPKLGFPDDCPELSDSFDLLNRATYQVFGESAFMDQQQQVRIAHQFMGTAWAVDDRLLATNAHVTEIFPQSAAQGVQFSRVIAVQSGTGTVIRLLRGFTHPDYTGNPLGSPDVGLFTSQQILPAPLPLAPAESILSLGDEIQVVGFPGDVQTFLSVVPGQTVAQATSLSGRVTARRSHDETESVTLETLDVYQHQAPTTPGTSGSSLFHCGLVAGINNAGTVKLILSPDPANQGQPRIDRQAAAANNFAVHVRHIHEMVDLFRADALQGEELPVAAAAPPPGGGGGGGGGGGSGAGAPGGGELDVAGRYTGAVTDPAAQHEIAFTIGDNGVIEGTSDWPETGQFVLAGEANPDGTFLITDDAPERLGFRRGVYQGTIAPDGSVRGLYFEQTQEQSSWAFAAQRAP